MATKARFAQEGARAAVERCAYMLLYAPGGTGEAGEPVRGGAWLQEQARMAAGAVPGLDRGRVGGRFGEICPALEAAIERGAADGLIARDGGGGIGLTPRGRRVAEALWEEAGRGPREAASIAKRLFNDMDYMELASFAHFVPTGAEVGPEIAGELDGRRLESAVGLARRHKVSITKAAEMAGMGVEDFESELRGRGIDPYYTDGKRMAESMKVIDSIIGH